MKTALLNEMAALTTARFVPENDYFGSVRPKKKEPMFTFGSNGEAGVSGDDPEHKYWKGGEHKPAEHQPAAPAAASGGDGGGEHKGEKMVFGVWRPVGRKLTSAEHQKVGSDYHKASKHHLAAAKEAAAAGDHAKAEHHFGEHVKTASAAKVHLKGWKGQAHDDFYAHPSHRPKGPDGQPGKAPESPDPFAAKPAAQGKVADPGYFAKHHADYVKTYGDRKKDWNFWAAPGHEKPPQAKDMTYAQAHAHAQQHNGLAAHEPFHGNIIPSTHPVANGGSEPPAGGNGGGFHVKVGKTGTKSGVKVTLAPKQ